MPPPELPHANTEGDGFTIVSGVLARSEVADLGEACEAVLCDPDGPRRRAGVRSLASRLPRIRELAHSRPIRSLVEPVIGPGAVLVRSILFDKSKRSNWDVVW